MHQWQLTILVLASLTGGVLFAWKEAALIVANKDLNHVLLTVFRVMLATLVLTPFLPRPVEIPTLVMSLVMMAGFWAPTHRLLLNERRISLGHRIPWYHLNTGFWDNLLSMLIPAMKYRFMAMCVIELVIAAAMHAQLQNQ